MEKIKHHLGLLPAWILTGVTMCAILWLTLAPKPLGDHKMLLFPYADKVCHALMFGFLTCVILVDIVRTHDFRHAGYGEILLAAVISTGIGASIEFIQEIMDAGRSYETADIAADAAGAFTAGAVWFAYRRYYEKHGS